MYFLTGFYENLETLIILSKTIDHKANVGSSVELKHAYNSYLRSIQPDFTLTAESHPDFVSDHKASAQLISLFTDKSKLNDMGQESVLAVHTSTPAELDFVQTRAFAALNKVSALDGNLGFIMNLIFNRLFTAGSHKAGGGSSSSAIGCVWLNPRPRWTEQDFCEFLVHELTHQMMFLDERRYGHYRDLANLEKEENFAYSSILNRQRPLDKVVHSLVVASEVLNFRKRYFDPGAQTFLHPPTEVMESSVVKTLESLRALKNDLLMDRAVRLLRLVEESESFSAAI